jgi:cytochrome c oxidase cbb3-type subunit 3
MTPRPARADSPAGEKTVYADPACSSRSRVLRFANLHISPTRPYGRLSLRQFTMVVSLVALMAAVVVLSAQTPAPAPAIPPPAPITPNSFPAQRRPPADSAVVERGRTLFATACSACHGVDARGGQLGGANLLRSVLVLNDEGGNLIGPVVRQGRPGTPMVPIQMADADITAIAAFLHALQGASRGQGMPPPGSEAPVNVVVGDARAGEAYFKANCSSCHSPTGDLAGFATRLTDPRQLQAAWVAGGRGRGSARRTVTATVAQPQGPAVAGRLVRIDDFVVTIALDDGTVRSFARAGDRPKVVVNDPLETHRSLLGKYTNKDMRDVTAYLVTLK